MKSLLVGLVKVYRNAISPMLGPKCRYTPTCSAYAIEAIENYGAWQGSILAVKRILRCHPWGGHGYDPVPNKDPKTKDSA
jgi:putative membrane protein insertion efficiency factor